MKHVALLIPTIDRIGGAERQVLLLAHGLRRRGWRVTVVTLLGTGGTAAQELRAEDIAHVSLDMRKALIDPRGWLRFRRWFLRERPQILHAHLPHAAWLARISRIFLRIPVLIDTIHTSATGTFVRRLGYRISDRLSDTVTAVSPSAAHAYRAAHIVSAAHLLVIPNGIDLAEWQPDPQAGAAVRSKLGIDDGFLWIAAGRLEPVKNYPALLQAFAQLPALARMAIAGAGPDEPPLRQLAQTLGIEDRTHFLGFRPDLPRLLQAADGFVLASRWEGLPMTLIEAGASAVPSVATAVPGSIDVLLPEETGLLAPPGDFRALAHTMRQLMEMPAEERDAMGERARQHAHAHYDLDRILDRWESLYARLGADTHCAALAAPAPRLQPHQD
ncbi:MAG TPA: glycosyltransferase [Terracidiphilus sp.]|nr:glycosyltransferase [Terracidiphilus sp.]